MKSVSAIPVEAVMPAEKKYPGPIKKDQSGISLFYPQTWCEHTSANDVVALFIRQVF